MERDFKRLVEFLQGFYHTGLLHQIKTMQVQKPVAAAPQQQAGDLDINMTIEALVVSGAEDRKYLLCC